MRNPTCVTRAVVRSRSTTTCLCIYRGGIDVMFMCTFNKEPVTSPSRGGASKTRARGVGVCHGDLLYSGRGDGVGLGAAAAMVVYGLFCARPVLSTCIN